jgi:hypothetical protein
MLFPSLLLLTGCSTARIAVDPPPPARSLVFVVNRASDPLDDVAVAFDSEWISFGTLLPGESSPALEVNEVWPHWGVRAKLAGRPLEPSRYCLSGAAPLATGIYSIELRPAGRPGAEPTSVHAFAVPIAATRRLP